VHGFTTYVNVPDALSLSQADLDRIFAEAKGIGFEAARIRASWASVNTASGVYDWTALDRAVNAALGANLPLMVTLQQPAPSWVTTATRQATFATFAAAVASRYRVGGHGITQMGKAVTAYQIWDEPNAIAENWPAAPVVQYGRSVPPTTAALTQQYANLLKNAATEIRRVAPGTQIIFAGLRAVQATRYDTSVVNPARYMQDCWAIARSYFDHAAYHPVGLPNAQLTDPPAPTAASIAQSDALQQVMRSDTRKKVIWTQVGYDTTLNTQTQQKYYLETLRWFGWRRRSYVAGLAIDYKDSPGRAAGLVSSNFTPKAAKAQVARWHDGVKRHTIFTVCGTQQDGWGLVSTDMNAAEQAAALALYQQLGGTGTPTPGEHPGDFRSPDTIMGTRANPDLFNWVPISYPASAPIGAAPLDNRWQPQNISMADSIKAGVAELVAMIQATPGTFALAGMSQGSAVISAVLRQMQPRQPLANRANDCIAAVAFGNPCRRVGGAFPGLTPAPGAGLISNNAALGGLSSITLPSWWMELSTVGDPVSAAPMTGPAGSVISSLANALIGVRGQAIQMLTMVTGSLVPVLDNNGGGAPGPIISAVTRLFRALGGSALAAIEAFLAEQASYGLANPHLLYGLRSIPGLPVGVPGVNSNSNYIDVGAAFINSRGAAVAPR
jgi:hypothetical protein